MWALLDERAMILRPSLRLTIGMRQGAITVISIAGGRASNSA